MSLLTYAYNPTAAVSSIVSAMEAGQRRQAQQEQIIAGIAKAVADDRRHALEFNRVQSFNEAKNAEDEARYGRREAEDRRRYDAENAPFSVPSVPTSVEPTPGVGTEPTQAQYETPAIDAPPGETQGVDLYNAGGPVPPSRSLLTGEETTAPDRLFTESMARKRASQLQEGLQAIQANPEAVADGAPGQVVQAADEAATQVAGIDAANRYAPPSLEGGNFGLESVPRPDPFKSVEPGAFAAADPLDTPNLASIGAPAGAPPRTDGLPAGRGEPANGPDQLIPANNITPGQRVSDYVRQLSGAGIPVRRKDVPGLVHAAFAAEERQRTKGGGTASSAESVDEMTRGLEFNAEHGTYKRPDGAEFFVGRSANGRVTLQPFKPQQVKASRWVQGSDGNAYALGSNGEPIQPVPDGVKLQFNSSAPRTFKDSEGSVYVMNPDGSHTVIVPGKAKIPSKESSDYTHALAEKGAAIAELRAKQEAKDKSWFHLGQGDVDKAKKRVEDADAVIGAFHERYPQLAPKPAAAPSAAPESPAAPTAGDGATFASADAVKAAVKAGTLAKEKAVEILKSQFGYN